MKRRVAIIVIGANLFLGACTEPGPPDCLADDTRYEVIRQTGIPILMGWPPEKGASWAAIETDFSRKQDSLGMRINLRREGGQVVISYHQDGKTVTETISLADVRNEARDKEVGRWHCVARLAMVTDQAGSNGTFFPVKYSSEFADGTKHYVEASIVP